MAKKLSDLEACPFCGGAEYFARHVAHGAVTYFSRFDGAEADNSNMYAGLSYSGGQRVWCAECGKLIGDQVQDRLTPSAEKALARGDGLRTIRNCHTYTS